MNKQILFVGNGLNQVGNSGLSWSVLLDQMQRDVVGYSNKELNKEKPFTLWFEELIANSNDSIDQLKSEFVEKLGEIKHNSLHELLLQSKATDILTTNYDYTIELAGIPSFEAAKSITKEITFSLYRYQILKEKKIWHIHGEAGTIGSVMLGMNHYSRYLHKIRSFLKNPIEKSGKKYRSKFNRESKHAELEITPCWVDMFLDSDVHMIGFGMDFTENDIWYLITEKNFLRKNRRTKSQTYFYYWSNGIEISTVKEQRRAKENKQNAKLEILESLGVKTVGKQADDYKEFYEKCIKAV